MFNVWNSEIANCKEINALSYQAYINENTGDRLSHYMCILFHITCN